METFLKEVVKQPAIVSGNSSGGVICLWLAANASKWVKAVIMEDPPLFACEWPRIKETVVFDVLKNYVDTFGSQKGSNKATYQPHFK